MGNFTFQKTGIDGLVMIQGKAYGDARGYFMETYQRRAFCENGVTCTFVQQNQSKSRKGVLRGLHFQKTYSQAKLVRVLSGSVFDAAVDIRPGSPTFGRWYGTVLTGADQKQLFLPKGMAHGFFVLSDEAIFTYQCDEFYHPEDEAGILWSDPEIGIAWPGEAAGALLNQRDGAFPTFREWRLQNGISR